MLNLPHARRWLEFDAMIAIIVVIASVGWMNVTDPDFFWHLKNGEIILESGSLFTVDIYSHTAKDTPIQITGWLFDVAIAWIHQNFGFAGIRVFAACFIFATWLAVYKCAKLYVVRSQTAALLGLFSIVLLAPLIAIRPNLFTHAAFAWVLFSALYLCRHHNFRALLWVIPLFIIWPYFHFGFAAGLLLLVLFVVAAWMDSFIPLTDNQPIQHLKNPFLIGIIISCALAALLNNYGATIYNDLFEMTVRAGTSPVSEWKSPDFKPPFQKILLVSLFIYILLLFVQKRSDSWLLFIIPAALLWSLLTAQRNQGFWAIILPVFVAIQVAGTAGTYQHAENKLSERLERNDPIPRITYYLNGILILLTLIVVAVRAPEVTKKHFTNAGALLPVEATDFLLNEVADGKLFNRYGSGGYLIWRTYPKFKVFVDGRYAPYTDQIIEDALYILAGRPDALNLLSKYEVEIAFAENDTALFHMLVTSAMFRLVYSDSKHSVFVLDNEKFKNLRSVAPQNDKNTIELESNT